MLAKMIYNTSSFGMKPTRGDHKVSKPLATLTVCRPRIRGKGEGGRGKGEGGRGKGEGGRGEGGGGGGRERRIPSLVSLNNDNKT